MQGVRQVSNPDFTKHCSHKRWKRVGDFCRDGWNKETGKPNVTSESWGREYCRGHFWATCGMDLQNSGVCSRPPPAGSPQDRQGPASWTLCIRLPSAILARGQQLLLTRALPVTCFKGVPGHLINKWTCMLRGDRAWPLGSTTQAHGNYAAQYRTFSWRQSSLPCH